MRGNTIANDVADASRDVGCGRRQTTCRRIRQHAETFAGDAVSLDMITVTARLGDQRRQHQQSFNLRVIQMIARRVCSHLNAARVRRYNCDIEYKGRMYRALLGTGVTHPFSVIESSPKYLIMPLHAANSTVVPIFGIACITFGIAGTITEYEFLVSDAIDEIILVRTKRRILKIPPYKFSVFRTRAQCRLLAPAV